MKYIEITSRKNSAVIEACELTKSKKARDISETFPIEGIKLFEEALQSGLEIKALFVTKKALDAYRISVEKASVSDIYIVTDEVYEKLTEESAPQGIFAIAKKPDINKLDGNTFEEGAFVLLEDIQNPLNIGAILRCCYSMGFEKVIFSQGCADIYNPKCARAAMGSLFKIKAYFADDLCVCAKNITSHGNRIFCTGLGDKSRRLGCFEFENKDSFVIGNEGHGASDKLMSVCTDSLFIPMNEGAESLNAATAAAIVMWEMKKNTLCSCK